MMISNVITTYGQDNYCFEYFLQKKMAPTNNNREEKAQTKL